jgi:hypothetical protein
MLIWETEFTALSVVSGELTIYRGPFVKADTMQEAVKHARVEGMDYLVVTGKWYEDIEEVRKEDEFYEKLDEAKGMDYDDFCDWLDLVTDKEQLEKIREEFSQEGGLKEYLKIIDTQIKHKYGEEG